MEKLTNPDFERFARSLEGGIVASSSRSFALVFDDNLTVNVVLHPDEKKVVTEIFVCDGARLTGPVRNSVVCAMLVLNSAGLCGKPFVCGLDSRDFITLCGSVSLTGLDPEGFADYLDYLLRQARRVRELVRALSFQGAALAFSIEPATQGGVQ